MTAQYHPTVVSYDRSAGHLITRACGDVKVNKHMTVEHCVSDMLVMKYLENGESGRREKRTIEERGGKEERERETE